MSDFHFVVRHGLTGIVLAAFTLVGLWMRGPDGTSLLPMAFLNQGPSSNLGIAVAGAVVVMLPVIGIVVQAVYILSLTVIAKFRAAFTAKQTAAGPPMFVDEARVVVADRLKEAAANVFSADVKGEDARARIARMRPDSPFVWLYYTDVPAHMVDWARRRRSYHYLGVTWAIAALLGIAIGLLAPNVAVWRHATHVEIVAVLACAWIAGAWYLAQGMWRDADEMELAWAYARLHPDLKHFVDDPRYDPTAAKPHRIDVRVVDGCAQKPVREEEPPTTTP